MRSLLMVCAVLLVASVACAATPGQVPDATLASFGLSGMQQMTDAQGSNVRGMGSYVSLTGGGVANALGGVYQYNNYAFVSDHSTQKNTSSLAYGVSGSLAVSGAALVTPGGTFVFVNGSIAVGGGYGYAK